MYKLIAIDIDGTLLNSKSELTQRTINALKKISQIGVYVVLTSGRMTDNITRFCNLIGADKYFIAENGASIINLQNGRTEYSRYLDKATVNKVLDICEENSIYYMVYTQRELIVRNIKHMAMFFYKQNYNPNARLSTIIAGRDYINSINTEYFTKLMICDEDRAVYESIVDKISNIKDIDITPVPHISVKKIMIDGKMQELKYSYADISAKDTNKWTAVETLAKHLNIPKEEIIAIGDNINDIEMIKNAGLGIAMENGSPHARSYAKIIAPSNDYDGVARVLESIFYA